MRRSVLCSVLLLFVLTATLTAQSPKLMFTKTMVREGALTALPAPDTTGGMTLNQALSSRRSTRAFTAEPVTEAQVGQLLWAAQGITSPRKQRTAPSAHAQYFLHVYVARADGFFEYIPDGHKLKLVSPLDLRAKISSNKTPVVFLIAGEYARAEAKFPAAQADRYVNLEAGHAAQNLVLEAAALGLSGVTVGGIDPAESKAAAGLPQEITPVYVIPIGHAAK